MRKDELKLDVDYAYWDGFGGFAIPRTGHKAEQAFKQTLRVRVLDTAAPVHQNDYLIPPKGTGVLFKLLERDGSNQMQKVRSVNGKRYKNQIVTRWQPNARHFTMEWSEFEKIVKPLMDELALQHARETELETAGKEAAAIIAKRLKLKGDMVTVDLSEHEWKQKEISEHVYLSIDVTWDDIRAMGVSIPARKEDA